MPIQVTPIEGHTHLGQTDRGDVVIRECPRMRVLDIASAYSSESSAEDILADFPFLTLPQIHQAIAYYIEHQAEIDAEIERLRTFWRSRGRMDEDTRQPRAGHRRVRSG